MPVVKGDTRTMCKCLRCGHAWLTDSGVTIPKCCAKCKSTLWNKPRVRAAKKSAAVLDIMENAKATGNVFRALKVLAAMDANRVASTVEPWQAQDVEPFLKLAQEHLQVFAEVWRGRNQ